MWTKANILRAFLLCPIRSPNTETHAFSSASATQEDRHTWSKKQTSRGVSSIRLGVEGGEDMRSARSATKRASRKIESSGKRRKKGWQRRKHVERISFPLKEARLPAIQGALDLAPFFEEHQRLSVASEAVDF